jgi:hypothetical protein
VRSAVSRLYVHSFEHDDAVREIAGLCRHNGWTLATWDIERGAATGCPPSHARGSS